MYKCVHHEHDLLMATTIVENGLDIPLANTILIHDAQNYGLSELYQLRGRVGRSNRRAYAYLLIPEDRELTDVARKRLAALKEFSELGSGFKIAALDLELRGAGTCWAPSSRATSVRSALRPIAGCSMRRSASFAARSSRSRSARRCDCTSTYTFPPTTSPRRRSGCAPTSGWPKPAMKNSGRGWSPSWPTDTARRPSRCGTSSSTPCSRMTPSAFGSRRSSGADRGCRFAFARTPRWTRRG